MRVFLCGDKISTARGKTSVMVDFRHECVMIGLLNNARVSLFLIGSFASWVYFVLVHLYTVGVALYSTVDNDN